MNNQYHTQVLRNSFLRRDDDFSLYTTTPYIGIIPHRWTGLPSSVVRRVVYGLIVNVDSLSKVRSGKVILYTLALC